METRTGHYKMLTTAVAAITVAAILAAALPVAAQVHGALRGRRLVRQATAPEPTPLQVLSDLLTRLQLTDEQRQTIKGIISAHKDQLLAVAGAEQATRAALREAIRQGTPDDAGVLAAAGAVARADVQLSLQRAAIFAEVYAVLTDEQRQELSAFAADVKAKLLERLGNLGGAETDPARLLAQRANRLGLTDEEKAQIREILAGHKSELSTILVAEVVARASLNAAIHQPEVNEVAVRRTCVMVAAADLQLDLERARIFSEIWAVLTPEQQEQLTDLLATVEARIAARVESLLSIFKVLF
jgi:Spy/CpxP family protein refolding chaperone